MQKNIKALVFDTETTGLTKKGLNVYKDFDSYPEIIQLAHTIYDESQNKLYESNSYIRPVGFEVPKEVTELIGIETSELIKVGLSLKYVLRHFISDLQKCDVIVGHNLGFDMNMIRSALLKLDIDITKIDKMIKSKYSVDTMLASVDYCKIPSAPEHKKWSKYKWPKLEELNNKLFNDEMENAHNALSDVHYTSRCYFELIKLNIIKL